MEEMPRKTTRNVAFMQQSGGTGPTAHYFMFKTSILALAPIQLFGWSATSE